jgi:hypothetical protein
MNIILSSKNKLKYNAAHLQDPFFGVNDSMKTSFKLLVPIVKKIIPNKRFPARKILSN